MNCINIIGRLVRAAELRYTTTGKAIATATVAVKRRFQNEIADFIPIRVWGAKGEKYLAPYGQKGRLVAVSGELHIDKWKDDNEQWHERSYILVNDLKFLDGKKEEKHEDNLEYEDGFAQIDNDEDIPF